MIASRKNTIQLDIRVSIIEHVGTPYMIQHNLYYRNGWQKLFKERLKHFNRNVSEQNTSERLFTFSELRTK